MAWQDRLRKASFRDVPFEVEEDQGKFGRRVQTHEFPQRDKPYTEDLGRATRRFTITGFVLGDDFMERRDALLAALEKEGPGPLVHPWLGTLVVSVEEVTTSHSLTDGRVCRFQMSFVEAGELAFPTAAASQGTQSLLAADALQEVAEADFLEAFQIEGLQSLVAEGALEDLGGFVDVLEGSLAGVSQVLTSPLQAFRDAFPSPPALGGTALVEAVRNLYQRGTAVLEVASRLASTVGGGGVYARNHNAVLALTAVATALTPATVPASSTTLSGEQRHKNSAAMAALLQRTTLVQAAGMASAMPMPVYDDGVQVRDALSKALDDASVNAADPVYLALQQLRARLHADITSRLAGAARLVAYTPRDAVPALVVAYDRYESVDREQEIVERNNIRHPGFVPVEPLRLLAS